ncbi:MAG: tRNA lysidine(34) synthetase TilS [Methylophilaceae bacterium]|nr:tRNA lysidine(34) synthetase TilS [Methylophilaceae bacterium]
MASSRKPPPADLVAHLKGFLKQYLPACRHFVLAFSGGLDSSVLLHLLVTLRPQLDFTLAAVHVNHGMSPHAPQWAAFCDAVCAEYDVPFQAISVVVPRQDGLGVEAAARRVRYQALFAQPGDAVLLAHHQDDQAETLLLQLLRGAGLKGLAAMPAAVRRQDKWLLRPLLGFSRKQLQEYATFHGLRWVEDESNLDPMYGRNYLRHVLMPELEKRFPAASRTLARSAAHLAQASQLLDEMAQMDAHLAVQDEKLDLTCLQSLSIPRAINLLRWWIAHHTDQTLPTRRLQEIHRQLVHAAVDARVCFAVGPYRLMRYRHRAWIVPAPGRVPTRLMWRGESRLTWGECGWLSFQRVTGQGLSLKRLGQGRISVRPRQGGEEFRSATGSTHSLKALLQRAGIPPWEREIMPLVYCEESLVWAPRMGSAAGFEARDGEPGLVIGWHQEAGD